MVSCTQTFLYASPHTQSNQPLLSAWLTLIHSSRISIDSDSSRKSSLHKATCPCSVLPCHLVLLLSLHLPPSVGMICLIVGDSARWARPTPVQYTTLPLHQPGPTTCHTLNIYEVTDSRTFWLQDSFTLLKIENPKEFLFMWVVPINTYYARN